MGKITDTVKAIKNDRELRIQFLKFIVVGVLNTLISLSVIYVLMLFEVGYKYANLFGYIAGVTNSFIFNKTWVFKSDKNMIKEMFMFLIVFVICFGLQYVILLTLVETCGINKYLSQLLAMGSYTVANFILNRLITFKK